MPCTVSSSANAHSIRSNGVKKSQPRRARSPQSTLRAHVRRSVVSPPAASQPFYRSAALIFAAALAVRLAHLWAMRHSPLFETLLGDANGYDLWAQQIAGGDWIGHDVFYQAPLYAYFLGAI